MQRRWSTSNYILSCVYQVHAFEQFLAFGEGQSMEGYTVVHIYVCTIMEDASVRVRVSVYSRKNKNKLTWSFEK